MKVRWYDFTGMPEGSTDGDAWIGIFHPDDQERARELWQLCLETAEPYEIEFRLRHRSSQYWWVLGRVLPVRNEGGSIVRWMGTSTDIHEQKLAQEALKECDRRKDEFLAMLAHELRNPLTPIISGAELLPLVPRADTRIRRISDVIVRQANHMTELVDDLLDVSRVTRGQVTRDKEPMGIKTVLAEAIEQVWPLVDSRGHAVRIHRPRRAEGDSASDWLSSKALSSCMVRPLRRKATALTRAVSLLLHYRALFNRVNVADLK
jgi:PAS domain S-box-containing protein